MSHHDVFRFKYSAWSFHLCMYTGPTEETPFVASASEGTTPAAKSDSDSSDSDSSSEHSEQDKDKNDGGILGMIAETLGLAPSKEEEDKTAAPAAADADAGATT